MNKDCYLEGQEVLWECTNLPLVSGGCKKHLAIFNKIEIDYFERNIRFSWKILVSKRLKDHCEHLL